MPCRKRVQKRKKNIFFFLTLKSCNGQFLIGKTTPYPYTGVSRWKNDFLKKHIFPYENKRFLSDTPFPLSKTRFPIKFRKNENFPIKPTNSLSKIFFFSPIKFSEKFPYQIIFLVNAISLSNWPIAYQNIKIHQKVKKDMNLFYGGNTTL